MAVRLAETLGLDNPSIRKLIMGAYLHDVGKIGTPDNILLKPGKLTDPEFEIMKKHVDHGIDIVSRPDDETKGWVTDAIEVVAGHHEKFNGKGYPSGISAESIPLVARIFSVADVFDALTCRRPYKEPFPFEKSIGIIMSDKGTSFDPRVVDAFATIAEDLYSKIAGREDERLPEELDDVIRRYFKAGLESLYI
jgi:HD-GYP domain-containing protein (c-di-GMP phosphodiesterase class II)